MDTHFFLLILDQPMTPTLAFPGILASRHTLPAQSITDTFLSFPVVSLWDALIAHTRCIDVVAHPHRRLRC